MNFVVGLFDTYHEADRAIRSLNAEGFDSRRLSLITREETLRADQAGFTAGDAAAGGAATGGLIGLLAGVSALVVPGIGPILTVGTIATALGLTAAGAGVGAATGGVLGALAGLGLPEQETSFYVESLKRGATLVSVEAETPEDQKRVRDILREAGAVDVHRRREEWKRSGWQESGEEPERVQQQH